MKYSVTYLICITFIFTACDQGLSPEEENAPMTAVSGIVYFQNWPPPESPPPDSVYDIRLVLFPIFPADSSIMDDIIAGRAVVYPGISDEHRLPHHVDSLSYQIQLPAGNYEYFAVAQQYGSNRFSDWQVVGHYDTTLQDPLPTTLHIEAGQLLSDIHIYADFDSVLLRP